MLIHNAALFLITSLCGRFGIVNANNIFNRADSSLQLVFKLIDASKHVSIGTLTPGYVANLQALQLTRPQQLNVVADVLPNASAVKSMKFEAYWNVSTARILNRTENAAPYALCGDTLGKTFNECSQFNSVGKQYTIIAKAYSQASGLGTLLVESTISFTIVGSGTNPRPTNRPSLRPTNAPVRLPTLSPDQSTRTCGVPKFDGSWISYTKLPVDVAESHGGMIGNKDFIVVSGFNGNFASTTQEVWAIDTTNLLSGWRRMDDYPIFPGVSHSAFAIYGQKLYICGGYIGPDPGTETSKCFIYDHSIMPGFGQWSSLASLPDGGRGGGGMVYDSSRNVLVFSTGAKRPIPQQHVTVDYSNTWMLNLQDSKAAWIPKADAKLVSNHVSFVTARDQYGLERHYFLGGQTGTNEPNGNSNKVYEYIIASDQWVERAKMPLARGHASSSTFAYGCGFIIAAGVTNDPAPLSKPIDDTSYYDIPTDKWYYVGQTATKERTPVCAYAKNDGGYMHCEMPFGGQSYKRKLV